MNLASLLVFQLNIKLIENVSSLTSQIVKDQHLIEDQKQRSKRAQAEYEYLTRART